MRKTLRFYLMTAFPFFGIIQISCQQMATESTDELFQPYDSGSASVIYEGDTLQVGDTLYGYKGYVKLIIGDLDCPLLLGVPHDGVEEGSPVIPETSSTGRDLYTKPLAATIATAFFNDTGLHPWIVINEIGRKRVDPNTYPEDVSTRYENSDAVATYESYHELLSFARSTVADAQADGNGGLFVDIHGHAHKYDNGHEEPYTSTTTGGTQYSNFIDQIEVGYGLSIPQLEEPNSYIDTLEEYASVYAISQAHSSVDFSELIRGPYSFGSLLAGEGLQAVPSNDIPILERDADLFGYDGEEPDHRPYFTGGYCTRQYGTIVRGRTIGFSDNISSLQIETPGITVRNNSSIRAVSGLRIKRAIINYLNHWYGYSFSNN